MMSKRRQETDARVKKKIMGWPEFALTYIAMLLLVGIQTGFIILPAFYNLNPNIRVAIIMLYWAMVALVFAVLTNRLIKRSYDKPIRSLSGAAKRVAEGDFSVYLSPIHTEEKRNYIDVMYEDFNKMVKELGSIETLKNDFVANVSHEIKTPLNIIRNYAYTLKKENFDINERDEYIDTIISSADNLTALVTNILKLNRLENQEILPITEPYDLCRQLSDIVMALDKPLEDKNINLAVEMDDQLLIRYDPGMIELVWHNLLSNAVKFTPPGGTVTLKQTSDADFITVSVSDTGCGMDDETIKRIFDKFYQSDTSHSGEGNGLGLALVRRILELVGGDITVHSKLGEGTTFTVKLAVK